jgi:hypothetical protein
MTSDTKMSSLYYGNTEFFSNGQNCFILSQNVPKFELYKHNDELFNIYYRIFMNFELLSILTDEPPDTFLEEYHPMTISSKLSSY